MGEVGDPELPERLERMLARSPYRGEPERHIEGGLAIAIQTRGWDASLATIGNWTVAVHGIIGNWSELAPAHGWNFPQDAASATKLAIAYEHLGDTLFAKLRGEYSILIHDRTRNHLIAVRDLWGRRPLFYEHARFRTYLASEIRQVRAGSGTPNEIDGDVLLQAILWKPTFPTETHVKGINRLLADRVNAIRHGQTDAPDIGSPIWKPPDAATERYDFKALTRELKFLVDQAVKRWFIGVPFAVSMSGGVDSSTLWWVCSESKRKGDQNAAFGHPYSMIQPGHKFDESTQIRRILTTTETQGTLIDRSEHDCLKALFQNSKKVDSPFHGVISMPPAFPSAMKRDNRELLLSGFGGDEILGGSPDYLFDLVRNGQLGWFARDLLHTRLPNHQTRTEFIIGKTVAPALKRVARWVRTQQRSCPPAWIHPSRYSTFALSDVTSGSPSRTGSEARHRIRIREAIAQFQSLAAQESSDQLYSTWGLEGGSPLIDLDILNFSMRLPPRAFSNGKRYKQLLRSVAFEGFGEEIRASPNPRPWFQLNERDVRSLERSMPPPSWFLTNEEIVDENGLQRLFERSRADPRSSSILGNLAVAEMVIRNLSCQ